MSKKKAKLTPWFPHQVKPVRKGVYERQYPYPRLPDPVYCKWDGKCWWTYGVTPEKAVSRERAPGSCEKAPWRGLAKKP